MTADADEWMTGTGEEKRKTNKIYSCYKKVAYIDSII